jgi:cytoskeletal protein CcmA (bactofilin family)
LNGTLICENADIEGNFEGDLNVTGLLTLRATAEIEGKVIAGKLSVEPGAIFNATCAMKGATGEKTNVVSATTDVERLKKQNHPFDRSQRIQKSKTEPST